MTQSEKPFEWMAWGGGDTAPQESQLVQMMSRENLASEAVFFSQGKSQEMRFDSDVVWVLVEGLAFVGIPGYGSTDMSPGDIMEVNASVLHDITVTSQKEAKFLRAFRK